MKRDEKGFGILGIFLGICIFVLVSSVGYYVWDANKNIPNNNENSSSSQSSSNERTDLTIKDIKKELEVINTGSTVIEKDNAVSEFTYDLENNGSMSIPSDVYANYGVRLAEFSVVAVKRVMTNNGLMLTKDTSSDSEPDYEFKSADLVCQIFGTSYFTRLKCAKISRINEFKSIIPEIRSVVSEKLSIKIAKDSTQSVSFYISGKLSGAIYSAIEVGKDTYNYGSYLSSFDKKSWKFIGQDTAGNGIATPAACELFTTKENALFKRSFCKTK